MRIIRIALIIIGVLAAARLALTVLSVVGWIMHLVMTLAVFAVALFIIYAIARSTMRGGRRTT